MPKKARKTSKKKANTRKAARRPQKKAARTKATTKKAARKPQKKHGGLPPKVAEKSPRKKLEDTSIYEEVTITCPGCGRVTRVIKLAGVDTRGLICERCSKGEFETEEMDF